MTGFSGQTGIYELIDIDEAISEMIISGNSDLQIKNYVLSRGYRPLFQIGLEKVKEGVICLEELLRVTSTGQQVLTDRSPARVSVNA